MATGVGHNAGSLQQCTQRLRLFRTEIDGATRQLLEYLEPADVRGML